eukprot:8525714-Lingulodinium_polyedra.AAC.1
MPFFQFSGGGSCIYVVWTQADIAETAVAQRRRVGAFLWGLSHYYEHIDRRRLTSRAREQSFPEQPLQ